MYWAKTRTSTDKLQDGGVGDDGLEIANMRDITTADLLASHRAILAELRRRGIVRTSNVPTGDFAEYLAAQATGGTLAPNSEKSYDVLTADGERLQVKARVVADPRARGERQLSAFRSWDFDAAIIVLFDADLGVRRAARLSADTLRVVARYREHVNGWIVHATDDLLDAGDDVTESIRAVAGEM
jgi:hypothetical protein